MSETRHEQLRQQCAEFHAEHPEVWELFVRFTLDRIRRGFKTYSAPAIFERIRWETDQARVDPAQQFKVNNNHRPFYSRRFMTMYPQYHGFFRTRYQPSKEEPASDLPELGPSDYPDTGEPVLTAEDLQTRAAMMHVAKRPIGGGNGGS